MNQGATLLDEIEAVYRRYVVMPSDTALTAVVLWAAYTHAQVAFDYAPRLLFTSAEKRSGKTLAMEITGHLALRPIFSANCTTAYLFRSLDEPATVIFDEADSIFGTRSRAEQNEELRGLINAGFQRGTPVGRCTGPTQTPTEFQVFAPVAMAAIGRLPDTIVDRAVNIRMKRRTAAEPVEPYRQSHNKDMLCDLAARLDEWLAANFALLHQARPDTPLTDRAADLWEPLLAVADLAGGKWPQAARRAAVALTSEAEEDTSLGHELLADCRRVLAAIAGDPIPSKTLVTALRELDEARWNDYGANGLTPHRLAKLLGAYGLHPGLDAGHRQRGYSRSAFGEAFDRWLAPPEEVSYPSQPSEPSTDLGIRDDGFFGDDASKCRNDGERRGRHRRPSPRSDGSDTSDDLRGGLLLDGTVIDLDDDANRLGRLSLSKPTFGSPTAGMSVVEMTDELCVGCGYPLPTVILDQGERLHPTCVPPDGGFDVVA